MSRGSIAWLFKTSIAEILRGGIGGCSGRGMADWARGADGGRKVKAARRGWRRSGSIRPTAGRCWRVRTETNPHEKCGRRWRRPRRAGGGSSRSGWRCGRQEGCVNGVEDSDYFGHGFGKRLKPCPIAVAEFSL